MENQALTIPAPDEAARPPENRLYTLSQTGTENYDRHIRQFNEWLAGRAVTVARINRYLNELQAGGYMPSSRRLKFFALKKGLLESLPEPKRKDAEFMHRLNGELETVKLPQIDLKVYSEKTLTREQYETLVENAPARVALIIETLYWTGVRISELIHMREKHCDKQPDFVYIRVVDAKYGKSRRVFIPRALYRQIRREFSDGEYLFIADRTGAPFSRGYLWREISMAGRKILGIRVHPHSFRHTFATEMIEKMGSVKAVSQYLGHSRTSITEDMYNHSQLEPEDVFGERIKSREMPPGSLQLNLDPFMMLALEKMARENGLEPDEQAERLLKMLLKARSK